jgi:hypothetical protein
VLLPGHESGKQLKRTDGMNTQSFTQRQSPTQAQQRSAVALDASSEVVIGGTVWPVFAPGQYVAEIVSSSEKLSPYAARDLAAKRRRADPDVQHWKWLLDLRIEAGTDARSARALELWRKKHDGRLPVTFHSCPFKRSTRSGRIVSPRRGEKLYESLLVLMGRPLVPGDRLKLHGFVGARVLVRAVDSARDSDGDRRATYARYTIARKLLSLADPPLQPLAESRQPVAYSRHSAQEAQEGTAVTERTSTSAEGAGVASPNRETVYDRLADDGHSSSPAGPTPSRERAQIERVFGRGADVAPRGPCPRCGERMFARFGEAGRCIWCEGSR